MLMQDFKIYSSDRKEMSQRRMARLHFAAVGDPKNINISWLTPFHYS